ncbi:hypothetical protein RHRU231_260008 [Rhodococcus ruber]|uniref:Uncharacterized protein n=1 Tax=Rhodococcus ruber TaxID=1830 RepID=A0A098BFE9_9NOCA|nr:hypothetical protein RHRU231_260008 [Rhodococcus ruber]
MSEPDQHHDGLLLTNSGHSAKLLVGGGPLAPVQRNATETLSVQPKNEIHCKQAAIDPRLISLGVVPVATQVGGDNRKAGQLVREAVRPTLYLQNPRDRGPIQVAVNAPELSIADSRCMESRCRSELHFIETDRLGGELPHRISAREEIQSDGRNCVQDVLSPNLPRTGSRVLATDHPQQSANSDILRNIGRFDSKERVELEVGTQYRPDAFGEIIDTVTIDVQRQIPDNIAQRSRAKCRTWRR